MPHLLDSMNCTIRHLQFDGFNTDNLWSIIITTIDRSYKDRFTMIKPFFFRSHMVCSFLVKESFISKSFSAFCCCPCFTTQSIPIIWRACNISLRVGIFPILTILLQMIFLSTEVTFQMLLIFWLWFSMVKFAALTMFRWSPFHHHQNLHLSRSCLPVLLVPSLGFFF